MEKSFVSAKAMSQRAETAGSSVEKWYEEQHEVSLTSSSVQISLRAGYREDKNIRISWQVVEFY